mgnify:CR=1 FL=1
MTTAILPTLIFPDIGNLELETEQITNLGADGIEIRRERLVPEETYFRRVKKKLQECRLTPVIYSIPSDLWENGNLNQCLPTYAEEAMWLEADWIKLGLGQQPTENPADCIAQVKELLKNLPCRLLIENSQQKLTGGTAKSFASFFASLPHEKLAMTFDTGNWQTVGESADEAYALLHSYVAYMHLKGAEARARTLGKANPSSQMIHGCCNVVIMRWLRLNSRCRNLILKEKIWLSHLSRRELI